MKKASLLCAVLVAVAIAIDAWLIAVYAPIEALQGPAQKIFYWHVPSAMAMMILFLLGGVSSLWYIIRRTAWADALAISFIEVGFLFCSIVLTTGPLWAKPIWGAWWTWEPRLTSTLFVWLVFLGYFLLRTSFENRDRAKLFSAALAIFGCLDIPVIWLSVKLWRGIHPALLGKPGSLPPEMSLVLRVSMMTVLLLTCLFV